MFRRLSSSLPKDPEFPADLEKLGYYVNEKDQIRSITNPTQEFHYFISKNERVLEVQREAMDTCIRANLNPRFAALPLSITRLPTIASPSDPHIPILTSPNLATARRILLYFGESNQDLGIFAYRICGKESLAAGSCISFVSDALAQGTLGKETAVVIANLGQLAWYRRGKRAMTVKSWEALPRRNGVSGALRLDPVKNRVEGNETQKQHVRSVFDFVEEKMAGGAVVDVVGLGEGAEEAVRFLDAEWGTWKGRVRGIAVGLGYLWEVGDEVGEEFKEFWGKRARAYLIHGDSLGTPLLGRQKMGCNCFSSGESQHTECIMPRAYKAMLEYFQLFHDVPEYEEAALNVDANEEETGRMVKWIEGDVERTGPGITFSMGGDGGRGEGTL